MKNKTNKKTPFQILTKGKAVGAALGLATLLLAVSGPAVSGPGQGQERVTVCHKGRLIEVALPALLPHLLHGDTTRCGR